MTLSEELDADIAREKARDGVVRWYLGYWAFCLRLWLRETEEKFWRTTAYLIPRRTAYFAFIRVYAILGAGPGPDVYDAMKRWEAGEGR